MDQKNIEFEVNEVIEDLKKKVDDITSTYEAQDQDIKDKLFEVKDNAVKTLNLVVDKLYKAIDNMIDEEELKKGLDTATLRSKQLYENTIKTIQDLRNSKIVNDTIAATEKVVRESKKNIEEFVSSEEFKNEIDKAKTTTVDVAEKALDTLKGWLLPEGDNQ